MTATTALTAQNTTGVSDIHVIPPLFLQKQIKACLEDIGADVVKIGMPISHPSSFGGAFQGLCHGFFLNELIGMLASKDTIDIVADTLEGFSVSSVILDPVMVATTGAQLLPQDAVATMRKRLLSMTTVLTPNIPEAMLLIRDAGLSDAEPQNLEEAKGLAKRVYSLGPRAVLLKGGHMPLTKDYVRAASMDQGDLIVDIFYDGKDFMTIEAPFSTSKNTHGTGCSLASAIAANLAKGASMDMAIQAACSYVEAGIRLAPNFGKGSGPLNHFHSLQYMPFAP